MDGMLGLGKGIDSPSELATSASTADQLSPAEDLSPTPSDPTGGRPLDRMSPILLVSLLRLTRHLPRNDT